MHSPGASRRGIEHVHVFEARLSLEDGAVINSFPAP